MSENTVKRLRSFRQTLRSIMHYYISPVIQLLKKKKLMSLVALKKAHKFLRAERFTLVSGLIVFVMDMEANFGLMAPNMRGCGKTIKRMVKESFFILMETRTKVSG